MSAIKKQTSLRWKHANELTPGGAIVATVWKAKVGRFDLTITNWPGTETIDWEIVIPGTDWRQGASESRFEATVSILKDRLVEKAQSMEAKASERETKS
jgi:hypothetical protein